MKRARAKETRTRVTRWQIAERITRAIVAGEWKPGERIPPQTALVERLGATGPTLEQALESLKQAGFLEARRREGTYVAAHPPHLWQYAFVFDAACGSRFYEMLRRRALAVNGGDTPRRVRVYVGVTGHADEEDYQRLLSDVRGRRVAGVVFANDPYRLADSELMTGCPVPMVAVASAPEQGWVQGVFPDYGAFFREASVFLASRGRSRPAHLGLGTRLNAIFRRELSRRGWDVPAWWSQACDAGEALSAKWAAQLLFQPGSGPRPDSLIVSDDHLASGAAEGLRELGLVPGRDLEVVAYSNFPEAPETCVPVTRLGFDVDGLVARCLSEVDRLREGGAVGPTRLTRPRFADGA